MKKFFYSLFAAVATMFAVTSCSQEEIIGNEASGETVEVSFNATMEGQAISRAIGDGLTVDELYFAVYDENGNEIGNLRQDGAHNNAVAVSGLGATVKVRLVKGQTYQFVFWAQKSGAAHYNTSDMKAIKVNDYTTVSNDETRDAFYAYVGATKVTGPFSQDVTLNRPFAQLNLGTTADDWGWAETAGITITDSKVTVKGEVYTTLNTFDGSVADAVDAEFALNAIPSQSDLLKTDNKEYYYLSSNYLLAPAGKVLSKEIVFALNAGNKEINTLKVYNAPLQRNWRTNIVGEILTGEGTFNITVDPIFDGDRNYDMPGSELHISDFMLKDGYAEVGSAEALLKWAYLANFTNNALGLQLTNDITLPAYTIEADAANETYVFTQTPITLDAEGKPSGSNWIPVGSNDPYYQGVIDGKNHTINGLTVVGTSYYQAFVALLKTENGIIRNLTIKDAVIYSSNAAVGAFVGNTNVGAIIDNCHVVSSKITGKDLVGGIVGYNQNQGSQKLTTVSNCSVDNTSVIKGTSVLSEVLQGVGGIAGMNYGGLILKCTNAATVNGVNSVGGIAGQTREYNSNASGYIIASHNSGNIQGHFAVGGIAGTNLHDTKFSNAESVIIGCSSTASTVTSDGNYTGLMVGQAINCKIYASWASAIAGKSLYVTSGSIVKESIYAFNSKDDVTSDKVSAMNNTISSYNSGKQATDMDYCSYNWNWASGSWPVVE